MLVRKLPLPSSLDLTLCFHAYFGMLWLAMVTLQVSRTLLLVENLLSVCSVCASFRVSFCVDLYRGV